jgi:nucleoside 2-deoxyribosyltransferase
MEQIEKLNNKIYILCPVRNITEKQKKEIEKYVKKMDKKNEVHYPPRNVDQDDETGINICKAHLEFMEKCDEVHIFWDRNSKGSHFDLGMAFALKRKMKLISHFQDRENHKSFLNVIFELQEQK